ncbi:MAG TPA: hypothetical protein VKI62_10030 [Bacteroidota bacterium]|nr:hypothetical protein [Bacteroidota bacterium]
MAILLKRPSGIYSHISYVNGRHVWRSTGVRSKKEAEKIVASNFKDKKKPQTHFTLSEFSTKFVDYAKTNFAPATVLLYDQVVRTFIRLMGNRNLDAYTVLDVESFKAKRLQGVSAVEAVPQWDIILKYLSR